MYDNSIKSMLNANEPESLLQPKKNLYRWHNENMVFAPCT